MEENNDKLRQLYLQMQVYQKQMKQVEEQLEGVNRKEGEIHFIKETMDEIKKAEKGKKILVPISNGIFIKAQVDNTEDLLVNVGSDVIVKKDIEETKKMMDAQLIELKKFQNSMEAEMDSLDIKIRQIENEFKEIENK